MSQALNLLPMAIVEARARNRRVRGWSTLTVALLAAFGLTWAARGLAERAAQRAAQRAAELTDAAGQNLDAVANLQQRAAQTAARLRALLAHRALNGLPSRYAALARTAPEGVVLKELSFGPMQAAPLPQPAPASAPSSRPATRRVAIVGFAADHARVSAFVAALADALGGADVQLVNASTDPRFRDYPVRFECAAKSVEATP